MGFAIKLWIIPYYSCEECKTHREKQGEGVDNYVKPLFEEQRSDAKQILHEAHAESCEQHKAYRKATTDGEYKFVEGESRGTTQ